MISFIICEDKKILAEKYSAEIEKFMMNYDIDYQCLIFDSYGKEFKETAKKDIGFKIYLLDIVTDNGTGIDAARLIREEYDDWTSMIIIITAYPEYRYDALGKRLMLVDFISKVDNCDQKLKDALLICMKNYDKKYNSLKYVYKNTAYNIELKTIISIEKEQDSKRCIILTTHGVFYIQGTLNSVLGQVDKRFVKCHRSLAVNIDQVESYNPKENILKFKDKTTTTLVSRNKKKELYNYVRGIS